MINFSPLRSRRLHVCLRELSIEDAIRIARMPAHLNEAGISATLAATVEPAEKPRIGQVTNPRLWTVHERIMVVAHYLASTSESGPDFPVGSAKFSAYLLDGADVPRESADLGVIGGDRWTCRPMLGAHAESIERLIGAGRLPAERYGWWVGAMAAMLTRDADKAFDVEDSSDAALDDYLAERAGVFRAFPESDFAAMLRAFLGGVEALDHFFRIDFADDGIRVLPAPAAEGGPENLPPARFCFADAISAFTLEVFGGAAQSGR